MSDIVSRFDFKSRNGDKLELLIEAHKVAQERANKSRAALVEAELALAPLREEVEGAQSEKENISCRLNIWWREYNAYLKSLEPATGGTNTVQRCE